MADYIERNKAAELLCEVICGSDRALCVSTYKNCRQARMIELQEIPAAPIRDDVEGAWVFDDNWWDFVCTNCRGRIGNERTYRFCPHCGARMIGVE